MSEAFKIALLVLCLILLQGATHGFLKMAAFEMDSLTIKAVLTNKWYLSSFGLFFWRVILWQLLISRMPLGRAYLTQSLNVVVILMVSSCVFDEDITVWNMVGSAVIVAGIINMFR